MSIDTFPDNEYAYFKDIPIYYYYRNFLKLPSLAYKKSNLGRKEPKTCFYSICLMLKKG